MLLIWGLYWGTQFRASAFLDLKKSYAMHGFCFLNARYLLFLISDMVEMHMRKCRVVQTTSSSGSVAASVLFRVYQVVGSFHLMSAFEYLGPN